MSLDKFYETTGTRHRTCGEIGLKPLLFIYSFLTHFSNTFLTGNTVFVCTLGKNRIQVCKAPPGLHLALKAFEVVQVIG